jgi:hypothetical protein
MTYTATTTYRKGNLAVFIFHRVTKQWVLWMACGNSMECAKRELDCCVNGLGVKAKIFMKD